MEKEVWKKRLQHRGDISAFLTHFTREAASMNPLEVLLKILGEKRIIASTTDKGFIIGSKPAVCFQDAPIYGLSQNILHEQLHQPELGGKVRYRGFGLAFEKPYVFKKGGRPVIYEKKDIAKVMLPSEEWWRIVSYDLSSDTSIVDWTHEREWRAQGDFEFELSETFVYLPNSKVYKEFIKKISPVTLAELRGIVVLTPVIH